MLVSQTHITNAPNGTFTRTLAAADQITVQENDYLGFFFLDRNPLRWKNKACYQASEMLR